MSWIRTQNLTLKNGGETIKFYACKSYRAKGSKKSSYTSNYLGSLRQNRFLNGHYRKIFNIKLFRRLDALVGKDSNEYELLYAMTQAKIDAIVSTLKPAITV